MRIHLPSTISPPSALQRDDGRNRRPTEAVLADALAVMLVDLMAVLSETPTIETLERLANRLDDRGRTANGTPAAALLGQVSVSLMRMGL